MRYIRLLLATLVWFLAFSGTQICDNQSLPKRLKYLFKADMYCGEMGCGQRILIRQPPSKSLAESLTAVDDRVVMTRMGFTKEMRIQVLKELLTFQYDTVKSDKLLYIRGRWKNVEDEDFTIEIEALYSFTRMLTDGYPRILPVLIDRKTQEVITGKRDVINEVYGIYRKWLVENKKMGFKGFSFPLASSRYDWLGGDEDLDKYLKKSF